MRPEPPVFARLQGSVVKMTAMAVIALSQFASADDGIRRIVEDGDAAFADSVVVQGRELVHTTQLLPVDEHGQLVGPGDPARQIEQLVASLTAVLATQQAKPDDVIKLNVYVAEESVVLPLFRYWKSRFPESLPAMSLVTTRLPIDGAILAVDTVAARSPVVTDARTVRSKAAAVAGGEHQAHAAVLPLGGTIYISGQAEPGADLAEATSKTLAGLQRTLEHLGLTKDHVVQLKCFVTPMSEAERIHAEMDAFFGDELTPPVSLVEWTSTLPIEIEMVVHSPEDATKAGVTHEWLPWLTNSPVYCRLARVHGDTQIFVSGCFGTAGNDEGQQVADVFQQLQQRLTAAGSDLRHMAKATYYVSNDAASAAVNEIRPTLYDPEHPPAASKALVTGVGQMGGTMTLDMIAVPIE